MTSSKTNCSNEPTLVWTISANQLQWFQDYKWFIIWTNERARPVTSTDQKSYNIFCISTILQYRPTVSINQWENMFSRPIRIHFLGNSFWSSVSTGRRPPTIQTFLRPNENELSRWDNAFVYACKRIWTQERAVNEAKRQLK